MANKSDLDCAKFFQTRAVVANFLSNKFGLNRAIYQTSTVQSNLLYPLYIAPVVNANLNTSLKKLRVEYIDTIYQI